MTRQEVLERLCKLQEEVWDQTTDGDIPADCFCGKGGFWDTKGYTEADYRNGGAALEFIEKAVRDALALRKMIA